MKIKDYFSIHLHECYNNFLTFISEIKICLDYFISNFLEYYKREIKLVFKF